MATDLFQHPHCPAPCAEKSGSLASEREVAFVC